MIFKFGELFCGSKESVRKQIGMAVPPQGVQVVFQAILKSFAGIKYDCDRNKKIHPTQKAEKNHTDKEKMAKEYRAENNKLEKIETQYEETEANQLKYIQAKSNILTAKLFGNFISSKDRCLTFGVDISDFDKKKARLRAERRDIIRKIKKLKTVIKSLPKEKSTTTKIIL